MNKAWVIRIGLVFLILSFFIGFFWPIVFSPTPAETGVTPTPSVLPAFSSSDNTTATVVKLENSLVFLCPGANDQEALNALAGEFRAVEGVERVLVGGTVFDIGLSANVTANTTLFLSSAFAQSCPTGSAFRRASELSFLSTVTFTPPEGLDPIIARLPSQLCRQPNWSCLVFASTQENATIPVLVTLSRKEDGFEEGVVQEIAGFQVFEPSASPLANGS